MSRIGVAFSHGLSASEIVDSAQLAESLGYDSVWMAEGHGGDQFAVLSAVGAQTSRGQARHLHLERLRAFCTHPRDGGGGG